MQLFDCRAVASQVATLFRANRSGAVVLGFALTLGACAPTTWAPGPKVALADLEPTKARCSIFARHGGGSFEAFGPPKYVAGAAVGFSIAEAIRQDEDFTDCMVASGFYAVSPHAVAEQSSNIDQMNSFRGELRACIRTARENPKYGVLQEHFSDLSSDRFTFEQLTDERVPTMSESKLFAGYVDEVMSCNHRYADAVSEISPAVAQIIVDQESAIEQTLTLLVERQISWGEAARRQKQNQETAGAKLREVRV